jgi:hypothetical protein
LLCLNVDHLRFWRWRRRIEVLVKFGNWFARVARIMLGVFERVAPVSRASFTTARIEGNAAADTSCRIPCLPM